LKKNISHLLTHLKKFFNGSF